MSTVVGTKGQVVIEKKWREELGVKPGHLALQRIVDGELVIHFHPPEHTRSLAGSLSRYAREPFKPEDWRKVRDEAWAAASIESFNDGD